MMLLIVGLALFLGVHLLPTIPEVRDGLRNRVGAGAYKAIFSILSLIGFAVIVFGYHKMQLHPGKNPVLWDPPVWTRHIALLLMLPAMIFLVASQVPSRIRSAVKHPTLLAIKLWALAHLLSNGDLASLLLFGSFLAYAIYDRISVKQRGALGPLGDKQPSSILNDVIVVGAGLALYAALLLGGHAWLIGVAPLPSVSM
ncbi:MAG: NnrU family protein [Hyphomicrobium sp.]|nr:NnrU family protein [Hyphomicrobium sp.]